MEKTVNRLVKPMNLAQAMGKEPVPETKPVTRTALFRGRPAAVKRELDDLMKRMSTNTNFEIKSITQSEIPLGVCMYVVYTM